MYPRIQESYFSLRRLRFGYVLLVLLVSPLPTLANKTEKLIARTTISSSKRQELAHRLRTITGWSDLAFDSDGAMRIGHASPHEGSQSARNLLNRTFEGERVILFEDASSRKDVVFCRVELGSLEQSSIYSSEVYVVLIDFADFRQVTGDKQALAAFDVGWAVLHEIDHVVEGSEDPEQDVAGDCEDHINRMRRELGLPLRNNYFYSFLPVKNDGNLISRFVRLGFEQEFGKPSKRRRYWVVWDAAVVGGLDSRSESSRASLD